MDGKEALDFGASSDFPSLLRRQGFLGPAAQIGPMNKRAEIMPTESTTSLAFGAALFLRCHGGAVRSDRFWRDRLGLAGGAGNFVLRKYLGQKATAKNQPG